MRLIALLCALLITLPLAAAERRAITITSGDVNWAVSSTATGSISVAYPFVTVNLDRYTLRANGNANTSTKVLRYKVGLAFTNSSGQWDIARWSEPVEVNVSFIPGQTKLIQNYSGVIPIDGIRNLANHWVVLAVELETNGRTGFSYAHSERAVFQ